MASEETDDHDQAVVFGDEFVADEILARLPARCVARCAVLSKRFRQLLTTPHFWLRHRRLGPPPELPHVARLHRHLYGVAFEFHAVSPEFAMKHTVVDIEGCAYAGTCNGLVLLSGVSYADKGQYSVEGVVFNPATREEARLSLQLPHPQNERVQRGIMGFGYGPSSKVYKALIRETGLMEFGYGTRLMVVSLDGSDGGQEPRTVFSCDYHMLCHHSLHTADDGKVYFLICTTYLTGEEGRKIDMWETKPVLVFDVDNELATSVALPQGHEDDISDFLMLEIHGRPCIFKLEEEDTVIWLLTPDHRWEQLYILVNESSDPNDYFAGAWDCGAGFLLAVFRTSGAFLYNLHQAVVEDEEGGGGNRLAALSSLPIEYEWPEQFNGIWFGDSSDLVDYRPTLISPASVLGFVGRPRECDVRKHELEEMFVKMTQKRVVGPAMQMLANL